MPYKLTEKQARTIKTRFEMGMRHNERTYKEPFTRSLKLYSGEHYSSHRQLSQQARVVVNYTLHVVETRVNAAAFRYPRFVITPQTPLGEGTEPVTQAAIKYYWRKGLIQDELRRIKRDAEIYGLGVVWEGWKFETDDGVTVDDGDESDKPRKVREDRFFVRRIFPGNFVLSPECGRTLAEAQWCGFWELRPLDEIKKNPHFQNTRQIVGSEESLKSFLPRDFQKKDSPEDFPDDVKRVKLYHYFEAARQIHVIMCDEHDKVIYAEEWSWDTGRYPFRYLQGPGDEDTFVGQSMVLAIEHPQRELNEARSQLSNHRRMAVPKFQCGTGTLSDRAKNTLKSYDPLAIVETDREEPNSVVPIEIPPIQPEVYKTEEVVLSDIQRLAALGQYEMGNAPTKRTPTAEVNLISQQGGARSQNDVQAFEQLCADVAVDLVAWLKKFAVKTIALPIYPKGTNTRFWRPFSREEIRGEYDIEVAANSTAPPNDADTLQSIGFFIQSVNPLLQMLPVAGQMGVNLFPLLRQVLKALPDIEDVDEILQGLNPSAPNPMGSGPAGGLAPNPLAPGTPPAAVMGPGGGAPLAAPPAQAVPPELLAALAAAGGANGR
jgi:hypothetical protein